MSVESFGTEDRARSDGLAIPPRKDISNYVRFDWLCIQAVKIIPEKTEKEVNDSVGESTILVVLHNYNVASAEANKNVSDRTNCPTPRDL